MNKKRLLIINIICLLFIGINVNATCSSDEIKVLKEKASKIEFSHEYKLVEEEDYLSDGIIVADYSVTAYNLDSEINVYVTYTKYDDESRLFKYNKNKTTTLKNFVSGKLKVTIESNNKNCRGRLLRTDYIDLLHYNNYYNSEMCQDYPGFEYCAEEFLEEYIDNITFDKKLDNYIEKLKEEVVEDEHHEKKENNVFKIIVIIFISLIILTGVSVGIYFVIKKEKEKREL